MPANAGIQVCFPFNFPNSLDSGFRRNDGNEKRLDFHSTNREPLGSKPRVIQFFGTSTSRTLATVLESI
jgi:hypothetical protein